ncbi:hypothetical protein E3T61_00175 [Cryobacterium lactosi]|uniref:LPXTG cell wall anchor domain-containing protein n=1 Tax=Cryobacterium lactosi TaxID=1259202 RepID=A0A4R9BYV9_9MICO|nr:hypothetical protein E3T61_00175 [Cryobacterium lactosi]
MTIPAGAEAGTHHIVLVDSVTGFTVSSAAFTVSPAAAATNVKAATDTKSVSGALASTGFDALMPALLAGLLVLAGLGIGAFQLVTKRRRTAQ